MVASPRGCEGAVRAVSELADTRVANRAATLYYVNSNELDTTVESIVLPKIP